jgi:MinD-like ATPase involved in chromosome partitioning or flagellar assembly
LRVVLAVAGRPDELAEDLRAEGASLTAVVAPAALAEALALDAEDAAHARLGVLRDSEAIGRSQLLATLAEADLLVVDAHRAAVGDALVAACDRLAVRLVVRCARDVDRRLAAAYGLRAVDAAASAAEILDAAPPPPSGQRTRGRIVAVWGAAGAPGRTTIALGLAAELARDGRRVALVDADSHAPSIALATGLPDEGPGFAAACRQAERGSLTVAELTRIALSLGDVSVLAGINRPGRWPELSGTRVAAALEMCREWADDVVIDVAASLELDEEIVSDLDGPRRNAATLAALAAADVVVAVVAADPVGIARFIRAYADLRRVIGRTPVRVLVNKTRAGVLGIDPRAQVRRTLERYAGIGDVWFAPADARAVDTSLLRAMPVLQAAGRSALVAAIRRFVGEALEPPNVAPAHPGARRRERRRQSATDRPRASTRTRADGRVGSL